jgi:hypothetical protein
MVALLAACAGDRGRAPGNEFVGSQKCATCHQAEFKTWQNTYHANMVRPTREGLLKDAGENWAKDAKGNAGPTKGNIDGRSYQRDDVVLVIGSLWKQRYLVKNPQTGNHQFLDKQWNRMVKAWEPYGQKNDWETQCISCHVTGYRLVAYDDKKPEAQKYQFAEHNIGCEACHGPGAKHVQSASKQDIFNPKNASKPDASKVCGYCHVRKENYQFKTAQNHPREDQPHPIIGQSYKAGQDDWATWYPDRILIPGVHADEPVSKNYPDTDLNNAFWLDEQSKTSGLYDARKHHQEYQEFLQSKHASLMSCSDCHSPHATAAKPRTSARETCQGCHGNTYDVDRVMPGTASTAAGLFVRSHTFNKDQTRKGLLASGQPEYFFTPSSSVGR